jgi:hypothetical protein
MGCFQPSGFPSIVLAGFQAASNVIECILQKAKFQLGGEAELMTFYGLQLLE